MKTEKLIAGIIIIIIGLILLYWGYQKMQPDVIERSMGFLNDLSKSIGGEELPVAYKKDKTEATIMLIAGAVMSIIGLRYVLSSGRKD